MRLTALLAGALIALGVTGCATHHAWDVTTYAHHTPTWEYGNPNFQDTASGGDSDMGSAGGEAYGNAQYTHTMGSAVSAPAEQDYYEAARSPRDAGAPHRRDAGSY